MLRADRHSRVAHAQCWLQCAAAVPSASDWVQVATAASWHAMSMEGVRGGPADQVPTIAPMALRLGQPPTAVLVAGGHSAVMLSEHGHELHSIVLPVRPTTL